MPKKTRKKAKKRQKKAKKKKAKKALTVSAAPSPDLPAVGGLKVKAKRSKTTKRHPQLNQEDTTQQVIQSPELIDDFRQLIKRIKRSQHVIALLSMPEPVKYTLLFVIILFTLTLMGLIMLPILIALTPHTPGDVIVESESQATVTTTTTSTTSSTASTTSTSSSTSVSSTTQHQIVCTPPYMRFGLGCCLDKNNNSICDTDEAKETTTTTLADYIRCFADRDCGPTRIEYKCVENDVFRVSVTHFCRGAGTRASSCETNKVEDLVDPCGPSQQCYIGKDGSGTCKNRYAPSNFL